MNKYRKWFDSFYIKKATIKAIQLTNDIIDRILKHT